jgi:hypothetical protein
MSDGSCRCPNGQLLIGNSCVPSAAIIVPAAIVGVMLLAFSIWYYVHWMVEQQDKMWNIKPSGKLGGTLT